MHKKLAWRKRYARKDPPGVVSIGHQAKKPLYISLSETHLLLLSGPDIPAVSPLVHNIVYQLVDQGITTYMLGSSAQNDHDNPIVIPADGAEDFLTQLDQINTARLQYENSQALSKLAVIVPSMCNLSLSAQNLLLKVVTLSRTTGILVVMAADYSPSSRAAAVIATVMPFAVVVNEADSMTYIYGDQSEAFDGYNFEKRRKP